MSSSNIQNDAIRILSDIEAGPESHIISHARSEVEHQTSTETSESATRKFAYEDDSDSRNPKSQLMRDFEAVLARVFVAAVIGKDPVEGSSKPSRPPIGDMFRNRLRHQGKGKQPENVPRPLVQRSEQRSETRAAENAASRQNGHIIKGHSERDPITEEDLANVPDEDHTMSPTSFGDGQLTPPSSQEGLRHAGPERSDARQNSQSPKRAHDQDDAETQEKRRRLSVSPIQKRCHGSGSPSQRDARHSTRNVTFGERRAFRPQGLRITIPDQPSSSAASSTIQQTRSPLRNAAPSRMSSPGYTVGSPHFSLSSPAGYRRASPAFSPTSPTLSPARPTGDVNRHWQHESPVWHGNGSPSSPSPASPRSPVASPERNTGSYWPGFSPCLPFGFQRDSPAFLGEPQSPTYATASPQHSPSSPVLRDRTASPAFAPSPPPQQLSPASPRSIGGASPVYGTGQRACSPSSPVYAQASLGGSVIYLGYSPSSPVYRGSSPERSPTAPGYSPGSPLQTQGQAPLGYDGISPGCSPGSPG